MEPIQEKFQTTAPFKEETATGDGWVEPTYNSRRQEKLCMPSTEIEEPTVNSMPMSIAGASDVSRGTTYKNSMKQGFEKNPMGMTDDLYTGEHADHFYGDAGGFVERNNYLDRL